ncbi:MAG: TetR/AcrR family transcriptional regulator [Proteobacteria bacterium]|nr:TetR/AcrR family transcriptional regulator [Pseudomonadota bacterium]
MARTQASDFNDRREFIIERALQLYAEKGFLGASVADLATACKTSKSLIYHYFPSKEDILFEAMDSHIKTLSNAASGIAGMDGASASDKLNALIHAFMHLYVGAAARHKVLINELYHLPPNRRDIIVGRQRRLIQLVVDLVADIQPQLKTRPELLRPAAMLFYGMLNWTHTWFDPKGPASVDSISELMSDLMIGGLKTLPVPSKKTRR